MLIIIFLHPLAQSCRLKIKQLRLDMAHSDLNVLVKKTAFACWMAIEKH